MTSRFIHHFDDPGEIVPESVGGKCASLARLRTAGVVIPAGFALDVDAYRAFIAEGGLDVVIASALAPLEPGDVDEIGRAAAQIAEAMRASPVPAAVERSLAAALDRLAARHGDTPLAVRSSSLSEDAGDASYAGQHDTFLWRHGLEDVVEHVRLCWASLYSARAISYRLDRGLDGSDGAMAVAVQQMIDARVSGVAFTLDPANGDRSTVVIEASWGIGELIAAGEVTPDVIRVDRVMLQILEERLGDKAIELVPDEQGRSLAIRDVDSDRRSRRCLSTREIAAVVHAAKHAEVVFGAPQDVEWALDRTLPDDRSLVVLQSRPETIWSRRESPPAPPVSQGSGVQSITRSLLSQLPAR